MRNHIGRYKNVKRPHRKNPPITIYDTSGPFTDPNIEIDIRKGLPRIREQWILDRNDVEELSEISSDYGKQDYMTKKLNHLRLSI
jgi:phosphomethylpyrimidine synthase